MKGMSRRGFMGAAAFVAASPCTLRYARAQGTAADEVTRALPRTYAGRSLSITWGSTPAYAQISACCSGTNLSSIPVASLNLPQ